MAPSTIDIELMDLLVVKMKTAIDTVTENAEIIDQSLDRVWLHCPDVNRFRWNGDHTARLDDLRTSLRTRAELAHQIAATRPTLTSPISPTSPFAVTVDIDEILLARDDAKRAAEWMTGGDQPLDVPQDLLDLFATHQGDTEFASLLAQRVPPDVLASFLTRIAAQRDLIDTEVSNGLRSPSDLTRFDITYDQLLDDVGSTWSLAVHQMSDDEVAVFADQFAAAMDAGVSNIAQPLLLSMVVGRGAWPDSFLTTITDTITAHDLGWWEITSGIRVVDPDGGPGTDGPVVVNDPLSGVFRSASVYNPGWIVDYFTAGGTTGVDLPGYSYDDGVTAEAQTVQMSTRLKQLLIDRGLTDESMVWFTQAATMAGLYEMQYEGSATFATSVTMAGEYWDRQATIYGHKSWWDKNKHEVLMMASMLVGMMTFFIGGAPGWLIAGLAAIDTAIVAWEAVEYFKDGDIKSGLINLGFALFPFAVAGVGTGVRAMRWIRLSRTEIEALETGRAITTLDGIDITPQMWTDLKARKYQLSDTTTNTAQSTAFRQYEIIHSAKATLREQAVNNLAAARQHLIDLGVADKDLPKITVDNINDITDTLLEKYPALSKEIKDFGRAAQVERKSYTDLHHASEDSGEQSARDSVENPKGKVLIDGTKWPDDMPPEIAGKPQKSGAGTFDVVGLSADGTILKLVEGKGGRSRLNKKGRIIGYDPITGQAIRAEQGSTDYLNDLLQTDPNLKVLFKYRPEIADGLRNGTIKIEYGLAKAPGNGTSTYTEFLIDSTRLDYSNLGR